MPQIAPGDQTSWLSPYVPPRRTVTTSFPMHLPGLDSFAEDVIYNEFEPPSLLAPTPLQLPALHELPVTVTHALPQQETAATTDIVNGSLAPQEAHATRTREASNVAIAAQPLQQVSLPQLPSEAQAQSALERQVQQQRERMEQRQRQRAIEVQQQQQQQQQRALALVHQKEPERLQRDEEEAQQAREADMHRAAVNSQHEPAAATERSPAAAVPQIEPHQNEASQHLVRDTPLPETESSGEEIVNPPTISSNNNNAGRGSGSAFAAELSAAAAHRQSRARSGEQLVLRIEAERRAKLRNQPSMARSMLAAFEARYVPPTTGQQSQPSESETERAAMFGT